MVVESLALVREKLMMSLAMRRVRVCVRADGCSRRRVRMGAFLCPFAGLLASEGVCKVGSEYGGERGKKRRK